MERMEKMERKEKNAGEDGEKGEKCRREKKKRSKRAKKIYPFGCNINYFSYICTRKGIIISNVYLKKKLRLWTCLYLLLLKSAASSST